MITGKHDAAKIREVINRLRTGPAFLRVSQRLTDSRMTTSEAIETFDLIRDDYKLFLRTHSLIRELNDLLPEDEKVKL